MCVSLFFFSARTLSIILAQPLLVLAGGVEQAAIVCYLTVCDQFPLIRETGGAFYTPRSSSVLIFAGVLVWLPFSSLGVLKPTEGSLLSATK